ncbi:hypothetical protein D3C71_1264450 [compost metagenome]
MQSTPATTAAMPPSWRRVKRSPNSRPDRTATQIGMAPIISVATCEAGAKRMPNEASNMNGTPAPSTMTSSRAMPIRAMSSRLRASTGHRNRADTAKRRNVTSYGRRLVVTARRVATDQPDQISATASP